ncbi:pyridoxine 5'-phosphate synthase [bacterium]
MIKLGVNIDHVATLRQARRGSVPDILEAALTCEKAGADSITVHLREDRRHIQDADVYLLNKNINTRLNLEMALSDEIINAACDVKPHNVCIVPEKREELTTEGGLDVQKFKEKTASAIEKLKAKNIVVSLFIEPDEMQIRTAKELGADAIEIHTGKYANLTGADCTKEFEIIKHASKIAVDLGLELNAGHGLDYENVKPIAEIYGMNELNIGYSVICESVFTGLESAVRKMKGLI